MRRMNEAEIRAFLTVGTRTGKLAVTRLDGSPMVVPIWFAVDEDDTLLFTTWAESIKGKSLRRDGRVSLCVDDERPPYAYVHVRGRAHIDEQSDLLAWTTRIAQRYVGAEQSEAYGRRNAVPTELLVRIRPERVIAEFDVAAW